MLVQAFSYLSLTEKLAYIQQEGQFMLEREAGQYKVSLFWCYGFFAEVWYHGLFKEIDYVRAFSSADILEPYLSDISIDALSEVIGNLDD